MGQKLNSAPFVFKLNLEGDKMIKKKTIIIIAYTAAISCIATSLIFSLYIKRYEKSNKELVNYYEVKKYIDENFYKDVDDEKLMESALMGMVAGLDDPYAEYMPPADYREAKENSSGSLVGIGVSVGKNENEEFEIMEIVSDSPASEAGIKEGDIIVKVDGTETKNMELTDLVSLIKGKENTDVNLMLRRDNSEIERTLTRKVIKSVTVEYQMLENNIAYIKINSFKEVTMEQYEESLNKALSDGAKKLIFDLRNNGGGQVTACEACLDPLLPEGDIATAEFRDGHSEVICRSDKEELIMPMAVLVNEYTASAAELFSSALRDFNKAKLVGTNTFGKGIMQNVVDLSFGAGLRITVAKYKTAKSDCYHEIGLAPDYEVELPENTDISKPDPKNDPQLKKAIEILS